MISHPAKYRFYVFVVLLTSLSACQLFYSDAEKRALEFVKVLVLRPDNKLAAMKSANLQADAQFNHLLAPLSVQIALNYLRTSLKLGKELAFDIVSTRQSDPRHQEVMIKVQRSRSNYQRADVVLISVSLVKDNQAGWQVVKLRVAEK